MPRTIDKMNIKDVAKLVGLNPVQCKCGNRIDATEAIARFFEEIINVVREQGELKIKNFGVFSRRIVKGRKFISGIVDGMKVEFDDSLALCFRQAKACKERINDEV